MALLRGQYILRKPQGCRAGSQFYSDKGAYGDPVGETGSIMYLDRMRSVIFFLKEVALS